MELVSVHEVDPTRSESPQIPATAQLTKVVRLPDGTQPFARGDRIEIDGRDLVVLDIKSGLAQRVTPNGIEVVTAYRLLVLPIRDRGAWPTGV